MTTAATYRELWELAAVFLRLGTTAFGGPAAHIAMMEDEVVARRAWLSREEFVDLLGATNLIPGPNSTELAIHIGYRRAGWVGLVVAGACFILPAALIVTAIAWSYVRFGKLPSAGGILYGVKPVIISVIVQALVRLGRTVLTTKMLVAVGVVAGGLSVAGVNELTILFACGAAMAVLGPIGRREQASAHLLLLATPTVGAPAVGLGLAPGTASVGLLALFLFFLKVGSVLFGSGYVLIAFLRADLVERWQWLGESQLLDAVAVGQVTPGPVFTTATFIGYVLCGLPGATLATIGIFLPAFFFVAVSGPFVPRLRRSKLAGDVLDGINVGSLALMAVVGVQLGGVAIVDGTTFVLAVLSAVLLVRYRVNSAWLVAGAALAGCVSTRMNL